MTDTTTDPGKKADADAKAKADAEAKAKADAEANAKKDPKDYILERKAKQVEELKKQLAEAEAEQEVFSPTSKEEPTVEELFNRRMQVEDKIAETIGKYPALEEHREKIRKYAFDPSRKSIPIEEVIVSAIGADEFMKLGAKLAQEANANANANRMGGNPYGGEVVDTEAKKRQEKFNKLPKFMANAQTAYNKQFNS